MSIEFTKIENIFLSGDMEQIDMIDLDTIVYEPKHHIEFIQYFVEHHKNYTQAQQPSILNYIMYPFRKHDNPTPIFAGMEQLTAQSLLRDLFKQYLVSNEKHLACVFVVIYKHTIFYSFRSLYNMCNERMLTWVSELLTDTLENELNYLLRISDKQETSPLVLPSELDKDIRYIITDMISEDYPDFLYMPLYEMRMRPQYTYINIPKNIPSELAVLKTYADLNLVNTLFEHSGCIYLDKLLSELDTAGIHKLKYLDSETAHTLLYMLEDCETHVHRCLNDRLPSYMNYKWYDYETCEKFKERLEMVREKMSLLSPENLFE